MYHLKYENSYKKANLIIIFLTYIQKLKESLSPVTASWSLELCDNICSLQSNSPGLTGSHSADTQGTFHALGPQQEVISLHGNIRSISSEKTQDIIVPGEKSHLQCEVSVIMKYTMQYHFVHRKTKVNLQRVYSVYTKENFNMKPPVTTQYGVTMPHDTMNLGHHWFR